MGRALSSAGRNTKRILPGSAKPAEQAQSKSTASTSITKTRNRSDHGVKPLAPDARARDSSARTRAHLCWLSGTNIATIAVEDHNNVHEGTKLQLYECSHPVGQTFQVEKNKDGSMNLGRADDASDGRAPEPVP